MAFIHKPIYYKTGNSFVVIASGWAEIQTPAYSAKAMPARILPTELSAEIRTTAYSADAMPAMILPAELSADIRTTMTYSAEAMPARNLPAELSPDIRTTVTYSAEAMPAKILPTRLSADIRTTAYSAETMSARILPTEWMNDLKFSGILTSKVIDADILVIKEQFINAVSNALEVHLKEKAPANLDDLAKAAEKYLTAHRTELYKEAKVAKKPVYRPPKQTGPSAFENPWHAPNEQVKGTSARDVRCYKCNQLGHIASKCHLSDQSRGPRNDKKCMFCDKFGHDIPECRKLKTIKTAYLDVEKSVEEAQTPVAQVSSFCSISAPPPEMDVAKIDACIKEGKLFLENGFAVPCMNACVPSNEDSMPVTKGRVGTHIVQVLRDSGCSSVVIKQNFVDPDLYTGTLVLVRLADNSFRRAPMAKIHINTPYLIGEVDAVCLPDAPYDFLIGNVPCARPAEDPDPAWQDTCDQETCAVATRAQAMREGKRPSPLVVPGSNLYKEVDRDEVCRLQKKDDTLKKFWTSKEERKGRQVIQFETRKLLLYRTFVHPDINHGNPVSQVMVPKPLRTQVLTLPHDSTLGGHLCAKKTKEKILREFYWPGMGADITRVSVDIIGKIHPPSEKGHQFILTMMDHASRYPDAVPLKNIDSESVAEALVDMFSRVGVPEEILSDLGTQFTSDCMKEVARLLSMRQLTTTPYHPMCNGLVEKFNGTLKQMLKKLCQEKPNQWHRYINAVLFAYREVPQESTGFSPFEILYGRSGKKMEETMKLANEALKLAQGRYKHYYDRRCRPRSLQVGDQVLILLPTDSNKLLMQWKGPFNVENIVGRNDYDTACAVFDNVSNSSIDIHEDEELLEIAPTSGSETIKDLMFGLNLDLHQERQIKELVREYEDIFTDIPGTSNKGEHKIELTSHEPVRSKTYRVPYGVRASLRKEIKDMLDMGIIQESASPYASPVVMVKKSDGSNRVCIDFRKLNRITIFDPEPMVTADDVFARLSESNFFTKIDFTKGYWQIKVRSEDVPKTAFVTPDGQYEFLKMPFGMVNAGATYVKCMRTLLKGLDNVESYIDDLLVHTKSWSEHLETLQELFQRILNANLTVRPSKCILASETVQFLGHEIQGGTLSLQETNISKIQSAPQPKTKKEVRSFLGFTGFYRAYVPNYATIAAPLSDLTKKGRSNVVQWQEPQEKAYNSLKSILVNKPVLRLPDLNRRFILRTDASDVGLGAVLLQEYEDGTQAKDYIEKVIEKAEIPVTNINPRNNFYTLQNRPPAISGKNRRQSCKDPTAIVTR
ncbi:uncharacterized protein [Palaemon carinicauda]|uniref:uncharacterized protein n=1 Tax=Palaemon carinicauda TaxID=392227 RepID=UPI0035B653E1